MSPRVRSITPTTIVALALAVVTTTAFSQQSSQPPQQAAAPQGQPMQRDVLAGKVIGPDGAIGGATVGVVPVGAPEGTQPRNARTDEEGRWLVAIQQGPGEYTVRATAIGMKPGVQTAKRGAPGKPILVDFRLERAPVQLGTVNIVDVPRTTPQREIQLQDQTSAGAFTGGLPGSIATADMGNLAAMAASIPGVMATPDGGFSVLGLGSSQNNVTMNGLTFSGGDIPRDGFVGTRVSTTSYDASRGGFSGGQIALQLGPGGNFATRLLHLSFDSPSLQATDQVGRRLAQEYTNTQVSGAGAGAFVLDKVFYNVSFQAGRRSSDLLSLLSSDPFALQRVGVSSDSVSRLLTAATAKGLPLSAAGTPGSRYTDNASVFGRVDFGRPVDTTQLYITGSLRYNKAEGAFLGATGTPAHGGDSRTAGGDFSARLSSLLFGTKFLNDLYVGAHINDVQGDPYSLMPNVGVLVSSAFADGTAGTTSLALGGNAQLPRNNRTSGWELRDQASWNSVSRKHRIRTGFDVREDAFSQDQYGNQRGTFFFNSISDFEQNRPSSFSRNFVSSQASSGEYVASAFFGDEWKPTTRTQFLIGVRADGSQFTDHPDYNPLIEQKFGARTDFTPKSVEFSPRAGFAYQFGTNGTTGIPGFGAPWGILRGGIGLFRNDIATTLVAPALLASGLSTGVRQVNCIGSAIPAPQWNTYVTNPENIPTTCADGSQGVGSSRVDLQACKLEYSIVSPK